MERWRAPTVLAWLEIALGMPQYGPRCAENVKSGKASYDTVTERTLFTLDRKNKSDYRVQSQLSS